MADFLGSVFGSKPQIAPYIPTDLGTEQALALEEDLKAWPQISQLGDLFQQSYLEQLNRAIPGFSDLLKLGGTTTAQELTTAGQELKGQIPQDVQEQVQRSSAFQNLLAGGGGGMASANTARQFGLTSLDLINQGANLAGQAGNAAQRWAGLSGAGASANFMQGMAITPEQQAAQDMQNRLYKQATLQRQYNVNAAPNPALQALNQWVEQVGGAAIGAYTGAKPGTNYKTSYDASQYTGQPSDITNPGYMMAPGGGAAGVGGAQPAFNDPFGTSGTPLASAGTSSNLGGYNFSGFDPYLSGANTTGSIYPSTPFNMTAGVAQPGAADFSFLNSILGSQNPNANLYGTSDFNVTQGYGYDPSYLYASAPSPGPTPF